MPSHGDPCSNRQDTSSAGRTTSGLSASAIPEALLRRTTKLSSAGRWKAVEARETGMRPASAGATGSAILLFPEEEIQCPAAPDVGDWAAAVPDQFGVLAAGLF